MKITPSLTIRNEGQTYYIVDLGEGKSPRFALYLDPDGKPIKKANNPYDFDKITLKPKGNQKWDSSMIYFMLPA